jgi:hypothetical protein
LRKGTKTSHHGLNTAGYRRATYSYNKEMQKCEFKLIS